MAAVRRIGPALMLLVLLLAACGGSEDKSGEPDCPTYTPGQPPPTVTTTVDPRCVGRATERTTPTDDAAGLAWQGTIHTDEGGPGMTGTTDGTFSVNIAPDGALSGSGNSHSTYSNAPPIDSQIAVSGKREGNGFRLVLAFTPGTRINVDAPVDGNFAEGSINLTGDAGTYSRGHVRLECQDCG